MSVILYNIFLQVYRCGIWIASWYHPKARKWVRGRQGLLDRLQETIPAGEKIIWVHCASLGEFEQGRPVMEAIKSRYPQYRILLSFFSPSGYEVQKNYAGADWVCYLPMDGPVNARRFLEIVQPSLVIFVKYEFWYYYLKKIKYRNIPLILISALFRKDMSFFRWYGALHRKILSRFNHLFVQNQSSLELIQGIGLGSISSISGDTRFDRVQTIARNWQPIPLLETFAGGQPVLVAGSTWPDDEAMLANCLADPELGKIKLVIAPHEINEKHLAELEKLFPSSIRYSSISRETVFPEDTRCLIIDNVGMLSRLYRYAWCCYVGGGMRKSGVHNVLEAAVYARPVIYGPAYTKYSEAVGLVKSGGAKSVGDAAAMKSLLKELLDDKKRYTSMAETAGHFVETQTGAVTIIMDFLQEKRLLTS